MWVLAHSTIRPPMTMNGANRTISSTVRGLISRPKIFMAASKSIITTDKYSIDKFGKGHYGRP